MINDDFLEIPENKKYNIVLGHIPYGNKIEIKFIEKMIKICEDYGNILVIIPKTTTPDITSSYRNYFSEINIIILDDVNDLLFLTKKQIKQINFDQNFNSDYKTLFNNKKRKLSND